MPCQTHIGDLSQPSTSFRKMLIFCYPSGIRFLIACTCIMQINYTMNHLSSKMLCFVIFINCWLGPPVWLSTIGEVPPGCSERVYSHGLGGLRLVWGRSLRSPGEREESRQRQSVSEYGGIGIWRRLTTWTGDHWGQVASRDHGGVHIRQPRHTGRGRGWVQEENLVIDTFKMLRGKSDLSKTRSRKSCYGIQKQSVRLKKFTAGIYLIEHLTFFSWVDDGVHNLLRGHIPGHRRGSHHPVRHLLQTAPEEEAQLWHQEG